MPKIYTRTGDKGQTSITHGQRVAKDDIRVEAYGTLDEVNSAIGLLIAKLTELQKDKPEVGFLNEAVAVLRQVQNDLFNVGFDWVWNSEAPSIESGHVERLEQWIDRWYEGVQPVDDFVLPGGSEVGAQAQMVRTLVRRAERRAVRLAREVAINPVSLTYVNRLSDVCFALARRLNTELGVGEAIIVRYGAKKKPPNRRF